jgi:hypothetical protein
MFFVDPLIYTLILLLSLNKIKLTLFNLDLILFSIKILANKDYYN